MPWRVETMESAREQFVREYLSGSWTMSGLCRAYGVSRPTGYKWIARYRSDGLEGLRDRSRSPQRHPNATRPEIVELILRARLRKPEWGPKKIPHVVREYLKRSDRLPCPSTIGAILARHGKVKRRKQRSGPCQELQGPTMVARGPNDIWTADYKGWVRLRDGSRCEPLVIADAFSRYMLVCRGLSGPDTASARRWFERAFREYGLPRVIWTDNGSPFCCTRTMGGLTRLSVWWVSLGIVPARGRVGTPQDNASHERMNRTLKESAMSRKHGNMRLQQRSLDDFRREFNDIRPHETLGQVPPMQLYEISDRSYPERVADLEYPAHFETRQVRTNGSIKLEGDFYRLSEILHGHRVGLNKLDDHLFEIHFGPLVIAQLNTQTKRVLKYKLTSRRAHNYL